MRAGGSLAGAAPVKSALRTLDIIEYVVARAGPCVAQEIASALAIPVSSLSYLLATLAERGYLAREGRHYLPGPGLARLSAGRAPSHYSAPLEPINALANHWPALH